MGDITLRQALEEYKVIYMASRNFAERTRVEYLNDLHDLIAFLEQIGLKEVKNLGIPQLERYLAELDRRRVAGSTRKRKFVSIRSFLWYLYQDGYLRVNLANRIIPPFSDVRSPRYLTKLEYERLLEVASNHSRDFAIIQVLLQTGMKLSELTHLTVQDVELTSDDVGYLHVLGNRLKKGRIIPLNSKACSALARYFKGKSMLPNNPLFINRFGKCLGGRGVEKVVQSYLLESQINDASVQTLRHTFGIHHIRSGADPKLIKEVMGYRDIRAVSIYESLVKSGIGKEIREHGL